MKECNRLTGAFVRNVQPPPRGRAEYWDSGWGLQLRVTSGGAKSWCVLYRFEGRMRRRTLGSYPKLNLDAARAAAQGAARAVALGKDPATEKRRVAAGSGTLKVIAKQFVARWCKPRQPRSWQSTERILERDLYPVLGERQMATISKADILEVLDKIGDRSPTAARALSKRIRPLFRWACDERGAIPRNPIAGLRAPAPEVERDRVLNDDELRALWAAWASDAPCDTGAKLMLLTGQRVMEVGGMRRSEIDPAGNWVIPAARYKTGRDHLVPLPKAARALIDAAPQFGDGDLVLTLDGKRPFNGWRKAKERMDAASGVKDWQFRDLRRTARTLMSRAGVPSDHAERVVRHVMGGVRGIYDRHEFEREKRRALERLSGLIEQIVSGAGAKVVQLRG